MKSTLYNKFLKLNDTNTTNKKDKSNTFLNKNILFFIFFFFSLKRQATFDVNRRTKKYKTTKKIQRIFVFQVKKFYFLFIFYFFFIFLFFMLSGLVVVLILIFFFIFKETFKWGVLSVVPPECFKLVQNEKGIENRHRLLDFEAYYFIQMSRKKNAKIKYKVQKYVT